MRFASHRGLPDAIIFGDETMRDGEPTPGVAFTPAQRLQIATLLDERGVPLMTFGIPVVSREETRDLKFCADAGLDASLMAAHR